MYTKLAEPVPAHEGAPHINAPPVYGASPGKPFLYRVPVTGERPMKFTADLPEGLAVNGAGVISGVVSAPGEYAVRIRVKNRAGEDEKTLKLMIAPGALLRTPLMGWTSWNAFRDKFDQSVIEDTAKALIDTGLAEYGYDYVNIDSDWQGEYGGKYDAIQPDGKFTDMKAMTDRIHSLGLKCGIYSTPMKLAFGICQTLPGCTRGEVDHRYPAYREIGRERMERNNVDQWVEWGFDYLKYDWYPNDIENAAPMAECIKKAPRDIVYCVTASAVYEDREWYKNNTNMFRIGGDSEDRWKIVKTINFDTDKWLGEGKIGGWADLDMLEIGYFAGHECALTPDEQVVSYTAKVIFPSPIQISFDLRRMTGNELRICCNEEVNAVNQDELGAQASLLYERKDGEIWIKAYEKKLADGSRAVAVFNLGETEEEYALQAPEGTVRDLWAKENLPCDGTLRFTMMPHTARLFKLL